MFILIYTQAELIKGRCKTHTLLSVSLERPGWRVRMYKASFVFVFTPSCFERHQMFKLQGRPLMRLVCRQLLFYLHKPASSSENRYRQKGGLKFLPSLKIQHNKYSKIVKQGVPRQEKYPALPGFPSQPAQNRPGPVCPAYLVHTAPTLHSFIGYSYIIHFFQSGVNTVLGVDCHSMLYLLYDQAVSKPLYKIVNINC